MRAVRLTGYDGFSMEEVMVVNRLLRGNDIVFFSALEGCFNGGRPDGRTAYAVRKVSGPKNFDAILETLGFKKKEGDSGKTVEFRAEGGSEEAIGRLKGFFASAGWTVREIDTEELLQSSFKGIKDGG